MKPEELEKSNRSKYGQKEDDLIARTYRDNKRDGDVWCVLNIQRYLTRFVRQGSSKANNLTDLLKARDYLDRMIEYNQFNENKEIVE